MWRSRTRMDMPRVDGRIAREQGRFVKLRETLSGRLVLFVMVLLFALNAFGQSVTSNATSVVELQRTLFKQTNIVRSFQLEGVVCAIVRERGFLVLQDKTGTLLFELPSVDQNIRAGDRVRVTGTDCLMTRGRFGIRVRTPVVDNDGLHSALLQTGKVFLNSGFQPVHLEWFNCLYEGALVLEYSGPGTTRQRIPGTVLWRKSQAEAAGSFQPGLDYAAYDDN